MRSFVVLLLTGIALATTGCIGPLIARSGTDPISLRTRDEVQKQLGEPITSETKSDGSVVEDFRSRRKFAEPMRSESMYRSQTRTDRFLPYSGFFVMLSDVTEVGRLVRRTAFGQTLRFAFYPDGRIRSVTIDGDIPDRLP